MAIRIQSKSWAAQGVFYLVLYYLFLWNIWKQPAINCVCVSYQTAWCFPSMVHDVPFPYFVFILCLWIFLWNAFPFVSWLTLIVLLDVSGSLSIALHWCIPPHNSWTVFSLDYLCFFHLCWGWDLSFHSFIFLCYSAWHLAGVQQIYIEQVKTWGFDLSPP